MRLYSYLSPEAVVDCNTVKTSLNHIGEVAEPCCIYCHDNTRDDLNKFENDTVILCCNIQGDLHTLGYLDDEYQINDKFREEFLNG